MCACVLLCVCVCVLLCVCVCVCGCTQVVTMLQRAPTMRPVQVKVLPTNDRIRRYLRYTASRSPSAQVSFTSPMVRFT